ncbi:MAG: putative 7-carboxy-7-deazaguanine synthase QueE [Lachnospiraceae bacterium]|nr:putative 7-carboxy-7-deazaguanine synthase QueE [Lachnospiraceae bacterium]
MKVVEKFVSINGESTRAGELAVFIRFKGCNLNCTYCDTKWANEPDCDFTEMTPEEIARYVEETKVKNVTLTGGEPLLQNEIGILVDRLYEIPGVRVEIETNGSVDIMTVQSVNRPSFTVDYKSPTSSCESRMCMTNYENVGKEDTVKFVVGSNEDLDKAKEIIDRYGLKDRCNVYMSPVFGMIEPADIVDYMIDNNMNGIRLQIQMHKVIWNPDQRGV